MRTFFQVLGCPQSDPRVGALIEEFSLLPDDSIAEAVYWESPPHGISLLQERNIVSSIFLHRQGKDDFQEFRGTLPAGVNFDSTRQQIRKTLGSPRESSEIRYINDVFYEAWDKYDILLLYSIHLTYSQSDTKPALITLLRTRDRALTLS